MGHFGGDLCVEVIRERVCMRSSAHRGVCGDSQVVNLRCCVVVAMRGCVVTVTLVCRLIAARSYRPAVVWVARFVSLSANYSLSISPQYDFSLRVLTAKRMSEEEEEL